MANDIRQKIVLEGEKEYNQAIREAQRNLRTLRSELKAETAEMGNNATAQQKNEAKVKSLKAQIKEQERIVQTYREALQQVREQYGDNEDAIQQWERKLNDARTTLANMKNQLDQTGSSIQSVGSESQRSTVETYALAESIGHIGETAESMAGAMEDAFMKVVEVIKGAITAVWDQLTEVAAKADEYSDLAAFLNTSATNVQRWSKAMESAGGSISTITMLIRQLKYGGKADKVTEWFGISDVNFQDDLEYAYQVLSQMADKKEQMVEAGTWDNAMSDIFGAKKVQEIDSVLSDWGNILNLLQVYDAENGGYGLTEEDIAKMNALNEQIMQLKGTWQTLKEMAVVHLFGDVAVRVTGDLQNIVDAFKEYFDAGSDDEKAAALEKIKQNVRDIVEAIAEALRGVSEVLSEVGKDLQKDEDQYVRLFGNILVGFSDMLAWFADPQNLEKVKAFFEGLFDLWIGAKAVSAISKIGTLLYRLTMLKNLGWGAGGAAAAGGAGAGGAAAGGAGAAAAAGAGAGATIGSTAAMAGGGMLFLASVAEVIYDLAVEIPKAYEKGEQSIKHAAEVRSENAEYEFMDVWEALEGYTTVAGENYETDMARMDELANRVMDYFDVDSQKSLFGIGIKDTQLSRLEELLPDELWEEFTDAAAEYYWGTGDRMDLERTFATVRDFLEMDMASRGVDADAWTPGDASAWLQLPGEIAASVGNSVSNISVYMDGEKVGNLVAPYVSTKIAYDAYP